MPEVPVNGCGAGVFYVRGWRMRRIRFAGFYLSALEATGLVVVRISGYQLDSRLFLRIRCGGKSFNTGHTEGHRVRCFLFSRPVLGGGAVAPRRIGRSR